VKDIATKADNVSSLSAAEFNNVQLEHENSITSSGQMLDEFNLFQQAEMVTRYASTGGVFYQDSGVADAYVLLPLGTFIVPEVYLDGAAAVFKIGNDSTGPSTINYAGGVKSLTLPDGSAISTEMITGEYATTRYNLADDRVELVNVSGGAGNVVGPVSAVDENIAVYDSITGKLIKDGGQSIADINILLQAPVSTTISTIVSGASSVLPLDNTIPQNTEGDEFITVTITPVSATSTLVIEFNGQFGHGANVIGVALFQDSVVAAIAAKIWPGESVSNDGSAGSIKHVRTSGTTSAITFKIRAGISSAGSVNLNGTFGGVQYFGGVSSAVLSVTEYAG